MKLTIRPSREYFSSATVSYCASTVMPKFDREEPNGFKSNGQLARSDRRRNCRVRGRQGCHGTGLPANESCLRHSGLAQNPPTGQADTQLLNPWGLVATSTSPWWISDNNAGVSSLYNGQGVKQGLVVNIPSPVSGVAGTPTGAIFTGASGFSFQADGKSAGAVFTFVTEDGTIVAWGPGINPQDLPNDAFVVVPNSNDPTAATEAVYKGATIAQVAAGGPSYLYVTNIRSGRVEVYDTKFNPVHLPDIDGRPALVDRE